MNLTFISGVAALSVVFGLASANRAVAQAPAEQQPSLTVPKVEATPLVGVTEVISETKTTDSNLPQVGTIPEGGKSSGTESSLAVGGNALSPEVQLPDLKGAPGAQIPQEVKVLATDFKAQAQAFLDKQKEISKKLKGATASERELIKEQLKASRALFLEQNTEIRNELKRRVLEMRSELVDSRSQVSGASEGGTKPGRRGD
jgi:hypothetical protein